MCGRGYVLKKVFWNILMDPVSRGELVFYGETIGDEWVNGVLKSVSTGIEYPVIDDVVVFVKDIDTGWSDELLERLKTEGWIKRNWENHIKKAGEKDLWSMFCREIAESNGLILDIASGPGGGLVPCILYYNDDAYVLMNDIEYRILLMWRRFLKNIGRGRYVGFLAVDARRLSIKDDSLDIVVSAGGFSNIVGQIDALREAYRVLKPGGKLYMVEGGVLKEDFMKLPENIRRELLEELPVLLGEWDRVVEELGFKVLSSVRHGLKTISPDERDLGKLAEKYGVTLHYSGVYVKAVKPS